MLRKGRKALAEMSDAPAGKLPGPRRLGTKPGHLRRPVVAGKCLEQTMSRKPNRWSVVDVAAAEPHPNR